MAGLNANNAANYGARVGSVAQENVITGEYQRVSEDGRWLFKDIDGTVLMYLWEGTPYQVVGEQREGDWVWMRVQLTDGVIGWVKVKSWQ